MEKKTLYALSALVVLSVVAVLALMRPEKNERVGERPRPVAEIKAGTIATLEITQPAPDKGDKKAADTVTLTKNGDKWQVTAPYNKPADQAAVKSAVESLEKMRWGDITTQRQDQHKEMEVSDDKAVHVVAKDSAGKTLADVFIGKSAGSGALVRVGGTSDVYQVAELSSYNFKKEGKAWRDHAIFDHKADEAERVTLAAGDKAVTLERLPPPAGADGKQAGSSSIYDAKWKLVPGDGKLGKPLGDVGQVDDALVNGVVQGVAGLHANDFLDSAKAEDVGLAPGAAGQMVVQVGFKGGKAAGIRIGALKGDDYSLQALDSPQIFTVKKLSLDRVAHLPQDVRDKTLVKLKEDQLAEVTIQQGQGAAAATLSLKRGDKGWKADKVAAQDDGKVKTVAESFENLTGTGFVAPGAQEAASLTKPKATVTLKPKTGAAVVLKVGDVKGDDQVVQKVGQDPMWVKKFQIERFLKKPADVASAKPDAKPDTKTDTKPAVRPDSMGNQ